MITILLNKIYNELYKSINNIIELLTVINEK